MVSLITYNCEMPSKLCFGWKFYIGSLMLCTSQNFFCCRFWINVIEHLIAQDKPKLNRCTELLSMNEELKQARKAFEVDEEKLASIE